MLNGWRIALPWNNSYSFIALAGAFLFGIISWGGFNWAMEMTNNESFCISCHEMEENVYREYKHTIHYLNRTGVRAICPDCHVPREWHHMLIRKISATGELWQKVRGTIDTREKFLARRPALVRNVWAAMKRTDSRECRNCHSFAYMDSAKQTSDSGEIHLEAKETGRTCIDCHMGIAHELPETLLDTEHERFEREGMACSNCHTDMPSPVADEQWDWDAE